MEKVNALLVVGFPLLIKFAFIGEHLQSIASLLNWAGAESSTTSICISLLLDDEFSIFEPLQLESLQNCWEPIPNHITKSKYTNSSCFLKVTLSISLDSARSCHLY